jgi:HK97 family phage prohead protease
MNRTIEIRTTGSAPAAGEGRTISGYAIVWNVESRVLASWDGSFIETIERGAVTDELIAASDVTALFNHERGQLLARSVNGEGTLKLTIDDTGLRFEFEAPNTTLGNDVLELVKRGDLRGCSFAFTANEEDIEYYRKGEQRYRTVRKLSGLYDVSVVVDPAYTQTSVDARSFDAPVLEEPKVSAEQLQRQADLRRIEIEKISINQPI